VWRRISNDSCFLEAICENRVLGGLSSDPHVLTVLHSQPCLAFISQCNRKMELPFVVWVVSIINVMLLFVLLGLLGTALTRAQNLTCTDRASSPFAPLANFTSPVWNCAGVNSCTATYCTCIGSSTTGPLCTSSASCTVVLSCMRQFTVCLSAASASVNTSLASPCGTWGSALSTEIISFYASESSTTLYGATNIGLSCGVYVCQIFAAQGFSSCQSSIGYVCPPPGLSSTPAPSPSGVSPSTIEGTLTLPGNYAGLSATALMQIGQGMAMDLSDVSGATANVTSIFVDSSGNLVARFQLMASNRASAVQAIGQMAAVDRSSAWLGQTQAAFTAAGAGVVPAAQVTASIVASPSPTILGSPYARVCATQCISFIIICGGALSVILIVGGVLFASKRNSVNSPTGQEMNTIN